MKNMHKEQFDNVQIDMHTMIEQPIKERQVLRVVEDNATRTLMALDTISLLLKHPEDQTIETIFNSIAEYFSTIATQDPNKIHYDNVRAEIERIKESITVQAGKKGINNTSPLFNALNSSSTIDQLSRELLSLCNVISIKLKEAGEKECYEQDDMFFWDKIYLDALSTYGNEGRKAKKELTPGCQSRLADFKMKKPYTYSTWINSPHSNQFTTELPFHQSTFFGIFVAIVWEDRIKSKITFAAENPPGTTTNVTTSITKLLSPANSIMQASDELQLQDKKKSVIASAKVSTFDSKMIERILSGKTNQLATLTAVRLIRFFIQETHNQYVSGKGNFFDLDFPGRAGQIAKSLGLKSNQDITTINALIMILDNLKFELPGINSRLISVADCSPNSRYSTKGGWKITVLAPLQPFFVFTDRGSFIIPLLKEPPLKGHKKYHALQYILQWKITEEFSTQSIELANHGYIRIPTEKWTEWFYSLEIPQKLFKDIHEAIIGSNGYLEPKGSDCYSIKEESSRKFLTNQGKIRISGSKGGKTTQHSIRIRKGFSG